MKITVITPDSNNAHGWSEALHSEPAFEVTTLDRPLRQVRLDLLGNNPDMLLVETTTPEDFVALESLASAHPEIDYVLVGTDLSQAFLLRAMRAGVREVLPAPASAEVVLATLRRQLRKRAVNTSATQQRGEILAVLSCKGGSGATFVAANLAHLLTWGGNRRVALIDLNLQFGDAAFFVTTEIPSSNVADVARNIDRLDYELLRSSMIHAAKGLWVLAAPEDPAQVADVTPEHVRQIVRMASKMFDCVVIDVGRSLTAVTLQALDLADRVYPVLQLTLPFIRDAKRLNGVFRSLDYGPQKIHWLVNRYEKSSQFTVDDLRKALAIDRVLTLPNHYEAVAASVNQGVPVEVIAPRSTIAHALRELAKGISPPPAGAGRGWLRRVFGSKPTIKGLS